MSDPNFDARRAVPHQPASPAVTDQPFQGSAADYQYPYIPPAAPHLAPQASESNQVARVVQAEALANSMRKETGVAYLLWFFLGEFGAHRFYMGKVGSAVAMLLIFLISIPLAFVFVGYFGLFAIFVWWIVDAFLIPGWVRTHNDLARRRAYGTYESPLV
jgi:TM2 domain-containing membrane protein YozV